MSTAMLTGAGTSAELERRDCDEHKCGELLQFVHKMQVVDAYHNCFLGELCRMVMDIMLLGKRG